MTWLIVALSCAVAIMGGVIASQIEIINFYKQDAKYWVEQFYKEQDRRYKEHELHVRF